MGKGGAFSIILVCVDGIDQEENGEYAEKQNFGKFLGHAKELFQDFDRIANKAVESLSILANAAAGAEDETSQKLRDSLTKASKSAKAKDGIKMAADFLEKQLEAKAIKLSDLNLKTDIKVDDFEEDVCRANQQYCMYAQQYVEKELQKDVPEQNNNKENDVSIQMYSDQDYDENENYEENTIWIFWWQGLDEMPPFITLICQNFVRHAPEGIRVQLVTKDNWKSYLPSESDRPKQKVLDELMKNHSFATLKDAILSSILTKYGGIATDMTNIIYKNRVQKLWNTFKEQEYDCAMYTYDESWDHFDVEPVAVWWIMATKESKIMNAYHAKAIQQEDIGYFAFGRDIFNPILRPYLETKDGAVDKTKFWSIPARYEGPQFDAKKWTVEEFSSHTKRTDCGLCWCYEWGLHETAVMWSGMNRHMEHKKDIFTKFLEEMKNSEIPFIKLFKSGGPTVKDWNWNQLMNKEDLMIHYMLTQAMNPSTPVEELPEKVLKFRTNIMKN